MELTIHDLDSSSRGVDLHTEKYDVLIASLGYEQRCTFVPQYLAARSANRWVSAFHDHRTLSFGRNLKWFSSKDFVIEDPPESEYKSWLGSKLQRTFPSSITRPVKVAVDISSMTRRRIAETLSYLVGHTASALEVDFFYAPAKYTPHSGEEGPVIVRAPLPGFAGWTTNPGLITTAVLGIGYEAGLAIGMVEHLEPASVWAFVPRGEDDRYDKTVEERNLDFWDLLAPTNVVPYDVARPFRTFVELEGLIHGLRAKSRPILVPLGPKLFTLCSLLVGIVHAPDVSVWRVSADTGRIPVDREASGRLSALRVSCGPSRKASPTRAEDMLVDS
jgi:hypothetical protein